MRRVFRIIGIAMFIIGVIFVVYALFHPEAGFPIPLWLTYFLYSIYMIIMLIFLVFPFKNKKNKNRLKSNK